MVQSEEKEHISIPLKPEIFCSYAHKDERLCRQLEQHLSLLSRQGAAILWHDRRIVPGADWSQEIDIRIESASLFLLLVSSDFINSDYCYGIEMQKALQRHEAKSACVIPILLRSCDWQSAPFAALQVLPKNAKPITMWRDRDVAWTDVVISIRQVLEEQFQAVTAQSRSFISAIWNAPFARNPFFTGREKLLEQLHKQFQANQTAQPLAISGLGGIGKTQLAIEYAYRYHEDYQTVLWVQADTEEALNASYRELAKLLNLPQKDSQEPVIITLAVKNWLSSHQGWLLILDNADKLSVVSPFLPTRLVGHLLLTTRTQVTGKMARRLEVETMDKETGALLLLRRAGIVAQDASLDDMVSAVDRAFAEELTEELGGLPLALDQAGAYIEETQCGLANYQSLYQAQGTQLLQTRGSFIDDHPDPVTTTWLLSFIQVEQRNPAAADLLRLCAFMAPDAILEEILTKGANELGDVLAPMVTNPLRFDQAITILRTYSLITRDSQNGKLIVHPLVAAVLRDSMTAETQQQWLQRSINVFDAAFSGLDGASGETLARLFPHIRAWIEQEPFVISQATRLLNTYERGRHEQLIHIIRKFRLLRRQIANFVTLRKSEGFTFENGEKQYHILYDETSAFLEIYLPEHLSNFEEAVQRKSTEQLHTRNDLTVSFTRLLIPPLANLEKLAAQIDACIATLESYGEKYFPEPERSS